MINLIQFEQKLFFSYNFKSINFHEILKKYCLFNKAPLHIAIEKQNIEIVKLLLARKEIDVNTKSVLKSF